MTFYMLMYPCSKAPVRDKWDQPVIFQSKEEAFEEKKLFEKDLARPLEVYRMEKENPPTTGYVFGLTTCEIKDIQGIPEGWSAALYSQTGEFAIVSLLKNGVTREFGLLFDSETNTYSLGAKVAERN